MTIAGAFRRIEPSPAEARLAAMLAARGIDCVIDAGGGCERFGAALFEGGYRGQLLSAESDPEAWRTVKATAGSSGRFWSVLPPMALGGRHGDAARGDGGAVAVRRIDDLIELGSIAPRFFLRIGAVYQALDGAGQALTEGRVTGVRVTLPANLPEVSRALEDRLRGHGFACHDLAPGARDGTTLQLIDCEATFFRD